MPARKRSPQAERAADRARLNLTRCPVVLWPNCSSCPCKQPLALGVAAHAPRGRAATVGAQTPVSFRTLQLNTGLTSARGGWGLGSKRYLAQTLLKLG